MRIIAKALLLTVPILALAGLALAQAPNSFIYQGRLVDADGAPITGATQVNFQIFATLTGGSNIYSATHTVDPDANGVFTQQLININNSVFDGTVRYMQLTVEGDVLSPRQAITSAPYAYSAEYAGTAEGVPSNSINGGNIVNNSLTDIDILDEPGIASGHYTLGYITLTVTPVNLDSAVITVPSSGYVVVFASSYYVPTHTSGIKDLARFSISETSATLDFSNLANISTPANASTDSDMPLPVALHAVYNISSAGTYRYYLVADRYSGAARTNKSRIVAMFFPTAYGVVDEKSSRYGGPPPDPTVSDGGYDKAGVGE